MIRRLRLISGLVMLAYVTMHLLNHAVGLISLETMENVLWYIFRIWTNRPAQLLLYSSFLVHYALALYALWQRRTLRLHASEMSQILLGFAIPLLLVRHVIVTRISDSFFHTDVGYYAYLLWVYFVRSPEHGVVQMLVLVVAWGHAMIGLHFWLRVRPWYARLQSAALVGAVLVPVLSVLGAIEAGRQVTALAADPNWIHEPITLPSPETQSTLDTITALLSWFFAGIVGAVLLARLARRIWQRHHGLVRIGYPDGRVVEVRPGTSVLEASRLAGIPHASVCGGRGRCSTCRIRVRGEIHSIDPPAEDELRVLRRIGATSSIRLACQLRPHGAVEVTPLLPPFAHAADGRRRVDLAQGSEREIAILFADIRGFTALSESRLPYDVVFILNRYFAAIGGAVEAAGGRVDKFIGDGVMALFGIERGAQAGCRDALAAARLMSARLDELNASLRAELDRPLRIGIGIHCGPTIVGEMGYGNVAAITAIGDAVNTASRLESLTKNFACELVVSEETASRAGLDLSAFPQREVEIRGKREVLAIRTLASAGELPVTDGVLIHRAAANNTLRPEAPCRADSAGSG
jgi:adenylate cyclase